jgi:predicted ATPase
VNGIAEPEVLDLLARLVEKSLVVYEEDEEGRGRYRLLETVRQYATEKLAAEPESAALHRQHRDHFLSLAERAKERLQGPEQREWLERLDADHDNLRAALDACAHDEQSSESGLHPLQQSLHRIRSCHVRAPCWRGGNSIGRARVNPTSLPGSIAPLFSIGRLVWPPPPGSR